MSPFASAALLVVIILVANALISMFAKRPAEWARVVSVALGFGVARFVIEHFAVTGIGRYALLVVIIVPFYYAGQYFRRRVARVV